MSGKEKDVDVGFENEVEGFTLEVTLPATLAPAVSPIEGGM
jgi:hypothetical protein